jgi:Uri superfamily endonuclease
VAGTYQILLYLSSDIDLKTRRADFHLKKGYYIYTGRAAANLFQRIKRHFKSDKIPFWHIDYLTRLPEAKLEGYRVCSLDVNDECEVNLDTFEKLTKPNFINGFGNSDCQRKCPAHLIWVENKKCPKEKWNWIQFL